MDDNLQPATTPLLVKSKMTPFPDRKATEYKGSGTLFSSMFTLANSAIGSGILAFPYAFMKTGLGLGLIVTLIFAAIMGACLHFVTACTHAAQQQDPRIRSYEELAKFAGGPKLAAFLEGTLIVYLLGCCCGFLIIVADMTVPIVGDHLGPQNPRSMIIIFVAAVIVFPLCLLRRISALRFSSMFAVCAVFYMVCAIAFEYFNMSESDSKDKVDHHFTWFEADADVLAALPLLAFALQCHIQAPLIYTELRSEERSVRRMDAVCAGAYSLCLVLYLPAGIFGYLTFGMNTETDILKGYPVSDKVSDTARVCIAIVACCGYPLNHFPARSALWGIWQRFQTEADSATMGRNWMGVEAAVWVAITIGVALNVTDLGVVFGLIGSVAGSLVIFFIPAFLWNKLGPKGHWSHKSGTFTALGVGTLVLVMGTLTTLKIL